VGRPRYPAELYDQRRFLATDAGALYQSLRRLIDIRSTTPEFAGTQLIEFETHNDRVLGYQRPGEQATIVVLANFGDGREQVDALTLSGIESGCFDLVTGAQLDLADGVDLAPGQFMWLRVPRAGVSASA
jgi:amylosucrase